MGRKEGIWKGQEEGREGMWGMERKSELRKRKGGFLWRGREKECREGGRSRGLKGGINRGEKKEGVCGEEEKNNEGKEGDVKVGEE